MLVLFAGVAGSVYAFAANGAQAAGTANNFLQSQAQVRAALDNIVDETRWAQSVTAASATAFTLSVPQNTPFSVGPYTVTFAYDPINQVVTRSQNGGLPVRLAYLIAGSGGTTGLTFSYFDAGGAALGSAPSNLGAIARVRINVSSTSGAVTRTLAGDTALRY